MNKLHGEKVTEVDVNELYALMPTLAKMIITLDDVREIENIGGAIQMGMLKMKDSLMGKFDTMEQESLGNISSTVGLLSELISDLIDHKK